eukprot:3691265-Amphidinium_carterae.1
MQSAGLNLAPSTPAIKVEDFSNASSMPKSTSSGTAHGPTCVSGAVAKLPPVSQVHWVKSCLKSGKVMY